MSIPQNMLCCRAGTCSKNLVRGIGVGAYAEYKKRNVNAMRGAMYDIGKFLGLGVLAR